MITVDSDDKKGQVTIRYTPKTTTRQDILLLSRGEAFELCEKLQTLLSTREHGQVGYAHPLLQRVLKDLFGKMFNVQVDLTVEYANDCSMVTGVDLVTSGGETVALFDLLRELPGGEDL